MLDPAIGGAAGAKRPFWAGLSLERTGIAAAFLILCILSYTRNVNWDEFYFLSHVHDWLNGRLDRPMQTGFVHAFGWLAHLPGHEMTQIFAGRVVVLACVTATALSLHRIALHFTSSRFADLAVLAYLCSGFVLAHAGSFRSDPIATALLMSGLAIALTGTLRVGHIFAVAALIALAFMVTIKSALYLPAFLAVLLWRMQDRALLLRLGLAFALALAIFVGLYSWHASLLMVAEGKETATTASNAVKTTLIRSGLFPRADTVLSWVLFSLPQLGLAVLGCTKAGSRRLLAVLALFAVPVLSVVIYRNAYVYFFPFATPLLMVAVALGAYRTLSAQALGKVAIAMLASAIVQVALISSEGAGNQRATVAEVHRLFDKPVPYIDGHAMIASFPNKSFFMSSWGVSRYRAKGQPVLAEVIQTEKPPLLLAHRRVVRLAMMQNPIPNSDEDLLLEDSLALRAAYIHYSGSIWLAGTKAILDGGTTNLKVPFEGRYRIEADGPVRINGKPANHGDVLTLDGKGFTASGANGTKFRVIWDTGVAPISRKELGFEIFHGFTSLVL